MNHVIVTSLALDRYNFGKGQGLWKVVEKNVDRLLHKLKPKEIILFLDLFNRQPNRANKDFLNKLLTIIPIHVEHLKDEELLKLMQVCISQDLVNERLFLYFIYPRLEKRAQRLNLKNYLYTLQLLSELHYQEDTAFWSEYILPCIFNYDYSSEEASKLWHALLKVKVDCPNVDVSKFLILIENIIKQFDNLKASGADITDVTLKVEKDYSLIPSKKETLTVKQMKVAEKRLQDQATLKSFMEKINETEGTSEDKVKEVQANINKLVDIKDWKKARYELNLAELEKLRQERAQIREERLGKTLKTTAAVEKTEETTSVAETEPVEPKIVDVAPEKVDTKPNNKKEKK